MLLLRAFYIFECLQTSLLTNAGKLNIVYFLAVCSASSSAVQQDFMSGVPQNESMLSLWIVKFKGKITLEHCYKFIVIFWFYCRMIKGCPLICSRKWGRWWTLIYTEEFLLALVSTAGYSAFTGKRFWCLPSRWSWCLDIQKAPRGLNWILIYSPHKQTNGIPTYGEKSLINAAIFIVTLMGSNSFCFLHV